MKTMYNGTDIKGKCWVDGETERDWQLSVQWTDIVSDARVGLYAVFAHAHFDDVTVDDPNGNPVEPPSTPEFGAELSAVTSIAAVAYMLVKQRLFKKRE